MSVERIECRSELPVTLAAVEQFCQEFRTWRASTSAAVNPFHAELLIREALTNSVMHGCLEDAGKRIWCVVRAKPGRLIIAVWDEGAGFDWRAVWQRQALASETHGRGIEIFRRYANSVRFSTKGNSVVLVQRFERQTNMNEGIISQEARGEAVLVPSGLDAAANGTSI